MAMTLAAVQSEVQGWYAPILGTLVNEDGAYGAQCKDLISHYIRVVHAEPYIYGDGDRMADNLISQRGWARVSTSATWQAGDVVSKWTGAAGGHVYVVLEDLGTSVRYVDQSGAGSAQDPAGPVTVRTAKKANIIAVARPPRYVGARAVTVPAPTASSAVEVLTEGGLFNAAAIVSGHRVSGVPLHILAAMVEKESNGKNVFGADFGGIFSPNPSPVVVDGVTYAGGQRVPVTRDNYRAFRSLLITPSGTRTGRTSNGAGPTQITWWEYHRDAPAQGVDLSDPAQNITFGGRILARHLGGSYAQHSVERAGTLYNAGNLNNGVNAYGRDLWVKAEKWRLLLDGATITDPDDGETVIVPGHPAEPDPETVAPIIGVPGAAAGEVVPVPDEGDPGARPALAVHAPAEVAPLSEVTPGPGVSAAAQVSQPMARFRWRDDWWCPLEWSMEWEQGIPGPDQSPWGSGMVAASGHVKLVRPTPLSRHGWNPWLDAIPLSGEPVLGEVTVDGGDTWHRIFTGVVDAADGAVDDMTVSMSIIEDVDRLAKAVTSMPRNFRMPSPVDGHRYMSIGLHAASVAAEWAARGGYRATPAPHRTATIMAAPMLGTVWPEVGTLEGATTIVPKGATTTIPSDSPEYGRAWWGPTVQNVWARYRPQIGPGATGDMSQQKGIRCFVGPVKNGPAFIELWWRTASIMVTVDWRGVTVETQEGWRENGWRNVLYGRTRSLTEEQKAAGFDLIVWLTPDRALAISVDGDISNHAPLPSYPRECQTTQMSQVRVTTRPGHTTIGAVQVYSTRDRSVAAPFTRTLVLDSDPLDGLFGVPALVGTPAIDLLREQAERLLVAVYFDEMGRLWWVGRQRMDARPSVRTLTEDDILAGSARWGVGRASVFGEVEGRWRQPSAFQARMSSAAAIDVWEGPADTLRPGETWEAVAHPDADVDWIHVDGSPTKIGLVNAALINQDTGSVLGGTNRQSDSDGKVTEGIPPVTWFNGEAVRGDWKSYPVEVRYRPPEGVKAVLQMSAPKIEGVSARYEGVGFLLRARARQVWKDFTTPRPKATGARTDAVYEHDGGWHVQSPAVMDKIITRLAQMFAQPLPAHEQLEVLIPDPAITRASTITLSLDGVVTPHRVVGIRWEGGQDGMRQVLALRQIRP